MKRRLTLFILPFLSACSFLPGIPDISLPTLYKDDINQGSVLNRFKVNQLKIGFSKAQVQTLIGSPSVTDLFHNNQWDYVNHSTLHQKNNIHYRLTLKFDKNQLVKIDTSGINSLPALTVKEKTLENQRLAQEKTVVKIKNLAPTKPVLKLGMQKTAVPKVKKQIVKTPENIRYVVKKGDTLWDIAKRYGINYKKLAKDNNLVLENILSIDQILIILK